MTRNRNNSYFEGVVTDITQEKSAAKKLDDTLENLENEVKERTQHLEETNIALRVLLNNRKDELEKIEKQYLFNIEKTVIPYLDKLKRTKLEDKQMEFIDLLEKNLANFASASNSKIFELYQKLTPGELQIINLIKTGKNSKDIAGILNIAVRTVETHRVNIRRKLGIGGKKVNLTSFLMSLENQEK